MRIGDKHIPLKALHTFETAARHLSMSLAAEELSVTQSAVSHQVRNLEEQLGSDLFDRSKKQLRLTPTGSRLYRIVGSSLEQIKFEVLNLETDSFSGELTIAVPPTFATLWLVPRLPELLERFPELEFHLTIMPVKAPAVLPEADIIVQFGKHHWARKRILKLADADYVPVCAPQLLKGIRRFQPEMLRDHILIHDDNGDAWAQWLSSVGVDNLQPKRHIYVEKSLDALELARLGVGIAMNDDVIMSHWIAEGKLVLPFDETVKGYDSYYLLTESEDKLPTVVREFELWLRQNMVK